MSLIVLGAVGAAAASLVGALAGRALWRRRRERTQLDTGSPAGGDTSGDGATGSMAARPAAQTPWPARCGDVIQVGSETRWLTSAVRMAQRGEPHCLLLLGIEGGRTLAAALFAPPRRDMLWLALEPLPLPPAPPSCIETGGRLLERQAILPVELSTEGELPIDVAERGELALYRGAGGEAALILWAGGKPLCLVGRRLAEGDYDNLGSGDPDGAGTPPPHS